MPEFITIQAQFSGDQLGRLVDAARTEGVHPHDFIRAAVAARCTESESAAAQKRLEALTSEIAAEDHTDSRVSASEIDRRLVGSRPAGKIDDNTVIETPFTGREQLEEHLEARASRLREAYPGKLSPDDREGMEEALAHHIETQQARLDAAKTAAAGGEGGQPKPGSHGNPGQDGGSATRSSVTVA